MCVRRTLAALLILGATAPVVGQTLSGNSQRVAAPALHWGSDGPDRSAVVPTVYTAALAPSESSTPVPPAQVPPAQAPTGQTTPGPASPDKGSLPPITDKNAPPPAVARRPIARVTSGNGTLPNEQGQVWREYDISTYTMRVTSTERPEQAIVDWILRETGYEAWHSEPLGVLSANRRTLRVYHTPAMHAVVADLVDRFVSSEAETSTFALHVITVDQPNWRTADQRLLHPVTVQTPGAMAWLLEKEDATVLLANLQRRSDYREHSSPHLLVNNGQATVVSSKRARPYIRNVSLRPDSPAGYETQMGQIDEGYSLDFSPLLSIDRRLIDATLKCEIDQVEKLVSVILEAPTQDRAAATHAGRSAADGPVPFPRALSLAGRTGAADRHGHGHLARPGRRQAGRRRDSAAVRQRAGTGRSAGAGRVQRADPRSPARDPRSTTGSEKLPGTVLEGSGQKTWRTGGTPCEVRRA